MGAGNVTAFTETTWTLPSLSSSSYSTCSAWRSGVGSGAVLGTSTGATGAGGAAEAEAAGGGGVERRVVLLAAAGSPLPSAKWAGMTIDGAPGSVE